MNTPLKDLTVVVFDTETTGLSPKTATIVEIAAIAFRPMDGHILGYFQTLIHQREDVPEEVVKIHGITKEVTRGGHTLSQAMMAFGSFAWGRGQLTVLMAHNAPFDIGFVGAAMRQVDLPTAAMPPVLCSQLVAKALWPYYKLQTIAEKQGIDPGSAHRAMADARTTMRFMLPIFQKLDPDDTLIDVPGARLYDFDAEVRKQLGERIGLAGTPYAGEQAALL